MKPLLRTKADVSEGIPITTFSSKDEEVDWEIENLTVRELYGRYVGVALFPR